jgi:hypothetical protein
MPTMNVAMVPALHWRAGDKFARGDVGSQVVEFVRLAIHVLVFRAQHRGYVVDQLAKGFGLHLGFQLLPEAQTGAQNNHGKHHDAGLQIARGEGNLGQHSQHAVERMLERAPKHDGPGGRFLAGQFVRAEFLQTPACFGPSQTTRAGAKTRQRGKMIGCSGFGQVVEEQIPACVLLQCAPAPICGFFPVEGSHQVVRI